MVMYGNGKTEYCPSCFREGFHSRLNHPKNIMGCDNCFRSKVFSPYYPILKEKHDQGVVFVKQEVSNLKKEDFNKNEKYER